MAPGVKCSTMSHEKIGAINCKDRVEVMNKKLTKKCNMFFVYSVAYCDESDVCGNLESEKR